MSAESNMTRLPEICYTVSNYSKELIQLKRGMQGYYPSSLTTEDASINRATADYLNRKLGVTKAQEQAMSIGSLFGFHVPGADPALWEQCVSPIQHMYSVSLSNGAYYFFIQSSGDGYDYTIYQSDLTDMDGGQLDDPSLSIEEATQTILSSHGLGHLEKVPCDPELLTEAIQRRNHTSPLHERIMLAQQRSTDNKKAPEANRSQSHHEQIY